MTRALAHPPSSPVLDAAQGLHHALYGKPAPINCAHPKRDCNFSTQPARLCPPVARAVRVIVQVHLRVLVANVGGVRAGEEDVSADGMLCVHARALPFCWQTRAARRSVAADMGRPRALLYMPSLGFVKDAGFNTVHFGEGVHLDQGLIRAAEQDLQVILHMQNDVTALGSHDNLTWQLHCWGPLLLCPPPQGLASRVLSTST